jgi:hypothetical protein
MDFDVVSVNQLDRISRLEDTLVRHVTLVVVEIDRRLAKTHAMVLAVAEGSVVSVLQPENARNTMLTNWNVNALRHFAVGQPQLGSLDSANLLPPIEFFEQTNLYLTVE